MKNDDHDGHDTDPGRVLVDAEGSCSRDLPGAAEESSLGVFVSYAWADVKRVRPIADGLMAAGHRVWIDTEQIHPASRFMDEIQPAIADLEAFAFFYSNKSAASTFCLRELDTAVASGSTIVAIWLDAPKSPLPSAIDGLAGVSAFDQPPSFVLERLLAALRIDAKLQRTLKSLSAAERQWRQSGRPDDLLLTRSRLAELGDGAQSELPQAIAIYVDRSRLFERHGATESLRLRRVDGIGNVRQQLQNGEAKAALATLLELATEGLDSNLRQLLTQALTLVGGRSSYKALARASRCAVKPDRSLWAGLEDKHHIVCMHPGSPLEAYWSAGGRVTLEMVDLAIEPSGDTICVAAEGENVYVVCRRGRPDGSDCVPDELVFEQYRPSDLLLRNLLETRRVWPLTWIIDAAPREILSLDFSPDSRWLAMAHADGFVRVYDYPSRRPVRWGHGIRAGVLPLVHRLPIAAGESIRFSRSGRYLLSVGSAPRSGSWRWHRGSASKRLVLAIIDTTTWTHIDYRPLRNPRDGGGVICARLSDDERWCFVSTTLSESAWLRHLESGATLQVPHKGVSQAEFTLDGRGLVTIGVDNVLRGWSWSPDSLSHDSVTAERVVVPLGRPTRQLLRDPQEPYMWVFDDNDSPMRGIYCDVFGDDGQLLELAREAAISNWPPPLP